MSPSAEIVPFSQTATVLVPATFAHDQDVAFEARLIDAAGNANVVRSLDVHLSLLSRVTGVVSFEGVPEVVADGAGATVSIVDATGAPVAGATGTTDATGAYALAGIPENTGVFVDVARDGWAAAHVRLPVLPTLTAAEAPTALDPVTLPLLRGSLTGVFRRSDLAADNAAHAGIVVTATLQSADRTFTTSTVTGPDGSYALRDLPVTRADESYGLEARHDDYGSATATAAVLPGTLSPVNPDASGIPQPVLLPKNTGDFDVCTVSGACVSTTFFKDAVVRVKVRDTTNVTEIRAQARTAFLAGDANPPFQAFPSANDFTVDISGADGLVDLFVQVKKADGSTSEVLSATVVRDTVPPVLQEVKRLTAAGALDPRFSKNNFVDVQIDADPGTGTVAPLAPARIAILPDDGSAAPVDPPGAASSCPPGTTCRVQLPGAATNTVAEALHRIAGWACDAAGNCSAPEESFVIHDQTPPSAAHGAGFSITGAAAVSAGVSLLRSPLYGISLDVGAAQDAGGGAVVDETGAAVADVYASRFSFAESTFDATVRALDPAPSASASRTDVTVPALPAVDGDYRVFGELFDAAGNATIVEPNAFFQDLRLDTQAPVVSFVVAGGADVVDSGTVSVDVVVPSGGEVPARMDLAADGGLFQTGVVTKTFPLDPAGETFTLPANGDGSYTVFARIFDAAGNVIERSDTVLLDTTPPSIVLASCLSCTASGGQLFTSNANAQLSVVASDVAAGGGSGAGADGSGVSSLEIDVEDANNAANATTQTVPFNGTASVALFPDTQNVITLRGIDRAGNTTGAGGALSLTVAHDDRAPVLSKVELADGAATTSSTQVVLRVDASDAETAVTRMRVSPTLDFSTAVATELRAVDFVDLTGADGSKQVCVQVEDAAGNTAADCDTVTLDRAAPVGAVDVTPLVTAATSVPAVLTYPADTAEVAVAPGALACSGATYVAATGSPQTVTVDLDGGDGTVRVFACFKDAAGNFSATPVSDTVVVDRTAPAASVLVDGGAEFTLDEQVGVAVTVAPAADAAQLALSADTAIDCSTATYQAFVSPQTVTLALTEGVHTIFACVKDAAGNTTAAPSSDSIFFDRADPTGSVLIEGGAALTRNSTVGVDITRSSDVVSMAVSAGALNCATATYEAFTSVRAVALAAPDGLKTVSVCLKDAAGRTALFSDDITLDTKPPLASIVINGDAATTSSPSVTVNATFDADAVEMALAAFPLDCASTPYGTLATDTPFDLLATSGAATVFACFRDAAGNTTAASDSIILEQASSGTLVVAINGGATATTTRNVTVSLVGPSDADQMKVAEAATLDCNDPVGYEAFATTKALTLAAGGAAPAEGSRTVSACVKTTSSQTLFSQDSILLDTFAPSGSVVIEGGAAVTRTADVTLSITKDADSSDVHQIGVSSSSATACQNFEAFVTTKTFTLGGADGGKSAFVCLRDDAGNTTVVTDDITLDRAAPSPVLVDVPDFSTATSITANLTFPAADTAQVAVAEGALDCASTAAYVPASATATVSLSASEGSKVIVACFKDAAGNTSQASDVTTLDLVAPAGSVVVNGGAVATTARDVTLTISASADVDRMALIESASTPDCDTATYVAFVQQPAFTLSSGDGDKSVQVCLQDRAGRKAAAVPDSIRLDQGAPDGSVVVNGGDAFTNRRDVILTVARNAGSEDASLMAVGEGALVCNAANLVYTAFQPTVPFTVSTGDGTKTVSLCLKDGAGNVSTTTRQDTITLDTSPPSGSTVSIANDAAFTTSATVTLTLTFPGDVTGVAVGNDGLDCSSATYAAPASTISGHALTPGDGEKTVAACLKDGAGNTFLAVDTIVLDTVAPSAADSSLAINGGAANTTSRDVSLVFTAPSDVHQVAVSESALNCATATYGALSSPLPFTLASGGDGTKTVNACLKEDAGRTVALTDTIVLDTTPPTATTFTINGVTSPVTNNPAVTVAVAASADVTGMAIQNGALDCTTASYGPFTSPVQFTVAGASPVTVSLCLQDRAGNTSVTGANTRDVVLDTTAPGGSVSINGGAAFATSRNVTLTLDTSPPESGLQKAVANDAVDCTSATFSALGAVPATVAQTLSGGDGTKTVFVCFKDPAGNVSVAQDSVVVDTADPVGTVAILDPEGNADGFANTANVTVALTLPGEDTGTAQMAVREAATLDCTSGALSYEAFSSTKALVLAGGQGLRTVSACFKDAAGRVTPAASVAHASITLDTVAPAGVLSVAEGSVVGGTHFVNTENVTAVISGTSPDVVGLAVSTSALNCATATYGPFSAATPVTLSIGEGDKTINACLEDGAGLTTALTTQVRLDTTAPAGTLTLDGGADYTADRNVDINVQSGEADLALKIPATDCTPPFNVSPFDGDETRTATIAGSEGTRTLGACLRDPAGNTTFLSDAINLDLTPPVGISATCASCLVDNTTGTPAFFTAGTDVDGDSVVDAAVLLGNVEAVDPNANGFVQSVVARVDLNGDGDFADTVGGVPETQIEAYDSFVPVRLGSADGPYAVHISFVDAAGNESPELDFDTSSPTPNPLVVNLDRAPPSAGTTFTVNGRLGDGTTSTARTVTQNVTVAFGLPVGNDVVAAIVTEGGSFAGLSPRPLADVLGNPFVLSSGDATKTLHARLFDRAGNATTLTAAPAIILDTTPPVILSFALSDATSGSTTTSDKHVVNATQSVVSETGLQMRILTPDNPDDNAGEVFGAFAGTASVDVAGAAGADGQKSAVLQVRDLARNLATANATIAVDTVAPTIASVTLASGASSTRNLSVQLNVDGAGATRMQVTVRDTDASTSTAGPVTAFQPQTLVTLPAGDCADGCKRVEVTLFDDAGNPSSVGFDTISLDTVAPSSVALSLAAGGAVVNKQTTAVTLTFTTGVTEAKEVALGEGIDCATASYAALTATSPDTSKTVTLTAGDGTKTVTACFRDASGNIATAADQIVLDTTAPAGISIALDGGAAKTNLVAGVPVQVVLPPGLVDVTGIALADRTGTTALACASATYVPFTGAATVSFSNAANQQKRVEACFEDAAGNRSGSSVSDAITLDTTLNAGSITLSLAGVPSQQFTRIQTIGATISGMNAEAVRKVELSELGTFADATAIAVAAGTDSILLPFTLSSGDGNKTVHLRVTDDAGNTNSAVTDTIVLDTTPPSAPRFNNTSVLVNGSGSVTINALATQAADTGSGLRSPRPYDLPEVSSSNCTASGMSFVSGNCEWNGTTPFTINASLLGEGETRFHVHAVDNAKNASTDDVVIITKDSVAPSPVSLDEAIPGDRQISLSWSVPGGLPPDVAGFHVHYQVNPGTSVFNCPSALPYDGDFAAQGLSPIDVGLSFGFQLTELSNDIPFCVAVTAYDHAGNEITSGFGPVSVTPYAVAPTLRADLTAAQMGTGTKVGAVAARDGLLYVASAGAPLVVMDAADDACFDVTDPTAFATCTHRIAGVGNLVDPRDIAVSGTVVFVADAGFGQGLRVFRVNDGSSITEFGFSPLQSVGGFSLGDAKSLSVQGNTLAVVSDFGVGLLNLDTVWSNAAPTLFSSITANSVTGKGVGVDIQGNRLAIGGSNGHNLWDITNPASPVEVTTDCSASTGLLRAAKLAGRTFYFVGVDNTLYSCDTFTGLERSSASTERAHIALLGPYLVTTGSGALEVIDASDRTDIRFIGRDDSGGFGDIDLGPLAVDKTRAYWATGVGSDLRVVDFTRVRALEQADQEGNLEGDNASTLLGDAYVNDISDVAHVQRFGVQIDASGSGVGINDLVEENGIVIALSTGHMRLETRSSNGGLTSPFVVATAASGTSATVASAVLRWPYLVTVEDGASVTVRSYDLTTWTSSVGPTLRSTQTIPVTAGVRLTKSSISYMRGSIYVGVGDFSGSDAARGVYRIPFNEASGGTLSTAQPGPVRHVRRHRPLAPRVPHALLEARRRAPGAELPHRHMERGEHPRDVRDRRRRRRPLAALRGQHRVLPALVERRRRPARLRHRRLRHRRAPTHAVPRLHHRGRRGGRRPHADQRARPPADPRQRPLTALSARRGCAGLRGRGRGGPTAGRRGPGRGRGCSRRRRRGWRGRRW